MSKFALAVALVCTCLDIAAFGQSSNANLSGTVSDAGKAFIPGVTVTATNTETGVVTTVVSNEAGTFTIPSLLPGTYKVSAELPGFQTQTYTNVQLGNAAQLRLNFTLQVASVNTAVEVTVAADRLLLDSTSSVGAVLPEKAVQDLPVVGIMGNDAVTGLIGTLPGINLSSDLVLGANNTMVAGVSAANVNIQRDGVDASASGRWPSGFQPATIMNPDMVGEVRMVTSPVDAELGRGNSQVQVQTRSGTNTFHGAGVYNIRNSAIEPNSWVNNQKGIIPNWTNLNEYTGSVGGPIIKNKTFFFFLWDGLLPATRSNTQATVLTPCARNGIFRYFDGWQNGNALTVINPSGTPTIATVDLSGNPVKPATNPDGTPFTGSLHYASVFGALPASLPAASPDCSNIAALVQPGTAWDPNRTGMDPTGYVAKVLGVMPKVNNYQVGDGLNTAGFQWTEAAHGANNRFSFGNAEVRKQLNIKIDHNFSAKNKINAGWTFEHDHADYAQGVWPTQFPGFAHHQPQVLTVNFTSTVSPTLLNEVRFGMRRTGTNTQHGLANPATSKAALNFIPAVQGIPVLPQLGMNPVPNPNAPAICICGGQPELSSEAPGGLFNGNISELTPLYTYTDGVTWTKGKHTFKGGGELRFGSSRFGDDVENGNYSAFARAFGGDSPLAPTQNIDATHMPGLQGTAITGAELYMHSLLSLLSGSLSQVTQMNWLASAKDTQFTDYRKSIQRIRQVNQNEASFFFKDDWKVKQDLTLNLGLRWDYYGPMWVSNGLTAAPVGGGFGLFGYSGRSFQDWMKPGQRGDLTQLQFIGSGSPNPGIKAWPKDYHNFGPAIGFAWQVPWFGAGQTTLRGGYQVSFLPAGGGRINALNATLANPPGSSYDATITQAPGLEYLDMTKLSNLVPVPVPISPLQPVLVTDRSVNFSAMDPHLTTPYVQNLTLALTRNVGRNLTVDARYIGTLSRKLYGSIDLNSSNFLYNGLKEAFDAARAGGESALLDQMFKGINLVGGPGTGPVGTTPPGGTLQTGAGQLRATTASNIRNNLANGNYLALANTLATLNYAASINPGLPPIPTGVQGAVLRYNGFAENFIKTNPQFNTATLQTNLGNTNYNSFQFQATLRPTAGVNLQGTYTWSKLLGRNGPFTTPVDRGPDYTLQPGDIRHQFRTNGSFALPVGPGQLLLGKSSGVFARAIEGWQMGWIVDLESGQPTNISAQNMLYANGVPDRVGSFNPHVGKVHWQSGALAGNYFGGAYTPVPDPQCSTLPLSLRSICNSNLTAIRNASGQIVLQNPQPGTRGNLGQNVIENPGMWSLNTSMSKSFRVKENINLRFRVDATDILNHPTPAIPQLSINSTTPTTGTTGPFGNIASKTGNRQIQGVLRLEF